MARVGVGPNMIVRDPVHGLMSFEGQAERIVSRLLQAPEFQRLRRIRQLGLASMVFPGAEHSRFSHGIGAAHVMNRLLRRLSRTEDSVPGCQRLSAEDQGSAVAAALVHDLGHGPFSHLFEDLVSRPGGHEGWTQRILRDPSTGAHQALESIRTGLAEDVAELLAGRARLPYLARAVSGTLDVDRCDYLLRDSLMTGVRYGLYDLDWLQEVLVLRPAPDGEWVLAIDGEKGLPPVEGFFLGRHHMHQQVYYHRGTRAAEHLVRAAFGRVRELIEVGQVPSPLPEAIRFAGEGREVPLGAYLDVDDATLQGCFAVWQRGRDAILADISKRIRMRMLFKSITIPEDPAVQQEILDRARELAKDHFWGEQRAVFVDTSGHAPYMEDQDGPEKVWVHMRNGSTQPLSKASFVLEQLANKKRSRARLMLVPELRDIIWDAVEPILR